MQPFEQFWFTGKKERENKQNLQVMHPAHLELQFAAPS
jgi:hypothetical protein